ncbi:GntR family transcriptional regulator [Glycomyces buryatensis]|uniref:GntR family transcriptional regulator n=1 Tax=Glycomyces buryatensis TaxID=2570927 RepID=A0A4S8QGS8_9ACTN|nr:GntR family transcriptional regulator [Glycomyces buryatensis]THV40589.1 GntR family transcriptional regulator [Glycomyces buryatensis]
MSPKVQRTKAAYEQIYEDLRDKIANDDLAVGDKVPSARQLADDWDVQPNTAMKALTVLRREGLTETILGKGTFVRDQQAHRTAQDRLRSIRSSGRIYPDNEYARILETELVPAPEPVAVALGLETGSPVIRRLRVTINRESETPVSVSTSWFNGSLATTSPDLLVAERLPEGTPAYIERTTNRRITAGRDQSAASAAAERDAELLQVEVGSPIKRGRNWLTDAEGDVVEYGESVSVADRWSTYSYEIHSETED